MVKASLNTNQVIVKSNQKQLSPWKIARNKFLKNKIAMTSLIIFTAFVLLAIFGPIFTTQDITRINFMSMNLEPSAEHWFGTDTNGRDVFTRMVYGARTSLLIGLSCMVLIISIGTIVGAIAGYNGGKIDQIFMRITDFVLNFPFLIFVIVLNTILVGKVSGVWTLILVISFLSWGGVARIVRSRFLSEKENEYVLAAKSIGTRPIKIIIKHILPNIASTIIVQATLMLAVTIVAEAGLSFLGSGVPANIPSWGNMLFEARDSDVLRNKTWIWVPPAAAITITILAINFIGEGIKDALNPKSRR